MYRRHHNHHHHHSHSHNSSIPYNCSGGTNYIEIYLLQNYHSAYIFECNCDNNNFLNNYLN